MQIIGQAPSQQLEPRPRRRYRLRPNVPGGPPHGYHVDAVWDAETGDYLRRNLSPETGPRGEKVPQTEYVKAQYFPGDIIETDIPLAALHPEKFEALDGTGQEAPSVQVVDSMAQRQGESGKDWLARIQAVVKEAQAQAETEAKAGSLHSTPAPQPPNTNIKATYESMTVAELVKVAENEFELDLSSLKTNGKKSFEDRDKPRIIAFLMQQKL